LRLFLILNLTALGIKYFYILCVVRGRDVEELFRN
jgi:hypothetical protein